MTQLYIALDVETGGIGHDKSLLTAYLGVYKREGEEFVLIGELDLKVRPNDGIYACTAEALDINKINLIEHDKIAITYGKAGELLRNFLVLHSNNGAIKLIPIGQNVQFDIQFLGAKILNINTIYKYLSYRVLDTGAIAQFLREIGLIPLTVEGGLDKLAEYFAIKPDGNLHNAKTDTLLTIAVLNHMLKLVKKS